MGSGTSYDEKSYRSYESLRSADAPKRAQLVAEHRSRVVDTREKVARGEVKAPPPVLRDEASVRDVSLARNLITSPPSEAKRALVLVVDNSGSNRVIAEHQRRSSGYFTSFLRAVDHQASVANVYFSDHTDGRLELQYADFVMPDARGDKQMFSSLERIETAGGDDIPEAIECALLRAAQIDFAHVARADRTLVLVTDSVPHRMDGWNEVFPGERDNGCSHQQSWRDSMREVRATYGQFVVIGSGGNPKMRALQSKLFETAPGVVDPEEVQRNFIDLSGIPTSAHRNGIVSNSVLFVAARTAGKQTMPVFFAALYAKWLSNPIFGKETDAKARERIRFMAEEYLGGVMTSDEVQEMLTDVLAE